MTENILTQANSPTTHQHKGDTVRWYPWGGEAFRAAKKENKPVLLWVMYGGCSPCQAMADESFSDVQTAELMNRFFINIKVDKDERPDVDVLYQQALRHFGGQSGWPATLFLTPESKPFFAGTYFPAVAKESPHDTHLSFRDVLWQVANMWRQDAAGAYTISAEAGESMRGFTAGHSGAHTMPQEKIDELVEKLVSLVDSEYGGFGQDGKFHYAPVLELMWQRACAKSHEGEAGGEPPGRHKRLLSAGVRLTLDNMCQGGIFDHDRGGFFRHTTDRAWQNPLPEKTLIDNAQMLALLTTVWQETQNPLYKDRAEKTARWLVAEMQLGSAENGQENKGGFATSVTSHAGKDEKVLAEANGHAIAALAQAGAVFSRPDWRTAAEQAFMAVIHTNSNGEDVLYHSRDAGTFCEVSPGKVSVSEDYAAMAHAALTLYETQQAGNKHELLEKAQMWLYRLMQYHEDTQKGGFYHTEIRNNDVFMTLKNSRDGATPSANGLAMQVAARLFHLTGSRVWQEQAKRIFGAFSGDIPGDVFCHAGLLLGQCYLLGWFPASDDNS